DGSDGESISGRTLSHVKLKHSRKSMGADRIIYGGTIRTIDTNRPEAQAIAIQAGRVIAVGDERDIRSLACDGTELTDLRGRTLLPGFVEAHSHPFWSAKSWGDPVVDI